MAERDRDEADQDGGEREQTLWLTELLDAAAEQYAPDPDQLGALVAARIARRGGRSGEREGAVGGRRGGRSGEREGAVGGRRGGRSGEREGAVGGRRGGQRGGRQAWSGGSRRGLGLLGRLGLAGIPVGVALSAIGAAVAIAVGATATIAVTSSHGSRTVTVAAPSTAPGEGGGSFPGPETSGRAGSVAASASTRPADPGITGSVSGSASSGTAPAAGPGSSALFTAVSSIGRASNPNWSELDLAVTIKQPLTELRVTVKVAKCAGMYTTGTWNSGPGGEFTETTATDSGGSVTYAFELVAGRQAPPATVTFAVQFNHAVNSWNPRDDTYSVSARAANSTSASAVGGAY